MRRIIEVVKESLIEKAHNRVQMPPKHWLERDTDRWFGGMSSLVPSIGFAAMKWQSGSNENEKRGLPYITGMLFLNALEDGVVSAIMDSTWITQQRTAAASALAVRHLAKAGCTSYGMLGAGIQARSHLEAFVQVIDKLEEVFIYDINPAASERFATTVKQAGLKPMIVDSARAVVEATDIVVSAGPIERDAERSIAPDWLHPGLLAVAIDYDCYWSAAALRAVDQVIVDDIKQINHIKEFGYFVDCREADCELGDVVAGLAPGRRSEQEKIVVTNMGVAVEDVATAKEIYEFAKNSGIGVKLEY